MNIKLGAFIMSFGRALVALSIVAGTVLILTKSASAAADRAGGALPVPAVDDALATAKGEQTAVFAGGCFWGIQAVFEHVKGVKSAISGYSGGKVASPSYEDVSSGTTGHAESVRVTYDPSQVTYGQLLRVFFSVAHDPTQLNRQGPDHGTQYRSAIFYANDSQKQVAEKYIAQLDAAKVYRSKIVTKVDPLRGFFKAEDYHQDYLVNHPDQPYIAYNDIPKVRNFARVLPALYQPTP